MILNGWKEIANYIGRGVRTVQRWEGLGLPVRRPNARLRSAVVTDSEELDRWLASCSNGRPGECPIPKDWSQGTVRAARNPELIAQLSHTRAQMRQLRDKMYAFRLRSEALQLEATSLLSSMNGARRYQERKDLAKAA